MDKLFDSVHEYLTRDFFRLNEITETIENEISLNIKACKSLENSGVYFAKVVNEFGEVSTNKATLTINSNLEYFDLFC